MLLLALADGALIFGAFIVLMLVGVIYGYYTRSGSAINQRPTDGRGHAPGAEGSSSITTTTGEGDDRTLGTHGTH